MNKKLLNAMALCAMMLVPVGAAADSYTTEVYDFKTWAAGSGSYTTAINTENQTSVTNTSKQKVYVETALFYGHNLNGRFAQSNANLESSNNGLKSTYNNTKARYFSILNLSVGDVVVIETADISGTLQVVSKNAVRTDLDGTVAALSTSENATHISGAQYMITSGTTFDLYLNASSGTFTLTKVTIRHLSALTNLGSETYSFSTWAPNKTGNTFSSSPSNSETTSSSNTKVYVETAAFEGGNDLNGRFAWENGLKVEANQGLLLTAKRKMASVLNLQKGDIVTITTGATNLYIRSKNVSYVSESNTVIEITTATEDNTCLITSGTAYTMTENGSFDFYSSGSDAYRIQSVVITKVQEMIIGDSKYRTFSSPWAVDISGQSNFKAYYAASMTENTVTLTEIADGIIPANTAVMLYGESGTFYYTTTDKTISGNLLQPVLSDAQEVGTSYDGKTTYVLAYHDSKIGFYKLSTASTGMGGKAYLLLNTPSGGSGGSARRISFSIGGNGNDNTTEISQVRESQPEEDDPVIYNLSGQRVGSDYKGLVIKNGKKYLVK